MPKCYSDAERSAILCELHAQAAQCMAQYGLRKTTVDELVKRAHIPKGTFYLFYASKEQLLFEVILKWHDQMEQSFLARLQPHLNALTADMLTDALVEVYHEVEATGLIQMLSNGELEALARKLPAEVLQQHFREDDDMVKQIARQIPGAKQKDAALYSAAFRQLFLSLLHRPQIGEKFDASLRLLLRGVVRQFMEEEQNS